MTSAIDDSGDFVSTFSELFPPQLSLAKSGPNSLGEASLLQIKASFRGLTPAERKIVANRAIVTSQNPNGMTPLAIIVETHSAAAPKIDAIEIVRYLLEECQADPNIGDDCGWTPLYRAATPAHAEIAQELLAHRADPNQPNKDHSVPLHRFVDVGNEAGVRALLNPRNPIQARVNLVNNFGTPLAYAAKNGNIPLANVLIEYGANCNLVSDHLGKTPLELARNNKKEAMVELLASKTGAAEVPPEHVIYTSFPALLQEPVDKKAVLLSFVAKERDGYGRLIAHYCAHNGQIDLLSDMSELGSVDVKDNIGRPPLHYAVMNGQEKAVETLVEKGGCDLNSKDAQGFTPLKWACQYNQEAAADQLLQKAEQKGMLRSMFETTDNFGWKVAHKIGQVGNVAMMEKFIAKYSKWGFDPHEPLQDGRTPLALAKRAGATEMVNYLENLPKTLPLDREKV